ncbi:MAG: NusG domain II-containing protein [Clostridia bacterium]|nr:NusG domain II-containing protein [Clostridia bacterium]
MKPNRWDVCVILLVILCAVLFLVGAKQTAEARHVIVSCRSEVVFCLPLDKDGRFPVEDKLTVVIENGEVYVEEAVCPDHLCEKHAPIRQAGRSIVCLPSQIVVSLEGTGQVDAIVQ